METSPGLCGKVQQSVYCHACNLVSQLLDLSASLKVHPAQLSISSSLNTVSKAGQAPLLLGIRHALLSQLAHSAGSACRHAVVLVLPL